MKVKVDNQEIDGHTAHLILELLAASDRINLLKSADVTVYLRPGRPITLGIEERLPASHPELHA